MRTYSKNMSDLSVFSDNESDNEGEQQQSRDKTIISGFLLLRHKSRAIN